MIQNVLLVDNDRFILEMISNFLSERGYEVLKAEGGLDALDMLKTFNPDILFIDLIMPNIDGKKLCQIIRGRPEFKNSYVVILSAVAAEEKVDPTEKYGVDACIAKGPAEEMKQNILDIIDRFDAVEKAKLLDKTYGIEKIYPREITKELLSARNHFEMILEKMKEGVMEINFDGRIIYANPASLFLTNLSEEELLGLKFEELFIPEDRQRIRERLDDPSEKPVPIGENSPAILSSNEMTLDFIPIAEEETTVIVILNDISEKKRIETEREKLIVELKKALAEIKTLSGFLPICSICKKIRDDKGYWNKLEDYLSEHSDASLTHSICPECLKKHYPEFSDE